MLVRVKSGKKGLVNYLKYGVRYDSELLRKDKDNTIALYGDINMLEKCEEYCNKNKQWKKNYEHITISFSKEEMKKFSELNENEYTQKLKDITLEYIKHRTSGYDLDNEVVAYGEVHEPKIKINEKGKDRLTHIHIGISYLNILSDTQIKTNFYKNSYISETFNSYICKKYDLEMPVKNKDKRKERLEENNIINIKSEWSILREKIINDCKNIYTENELIIYLNSLGYKWEKRKNKYTILPANMKAINLRGDKDFPTIENIINNRLNTSDFIESIRNQEMEKLQDTLTSYYKSRVELIDSRRSKETKEKIRDIYSENVKDENVNYLENLSFQQKIFYKHYGYLIEEKLKGFYIDTKDETKVKIVNKSKDINIVDNGDKICSFSSGTNLQEEIKLMLDIALAKGWKASAINVNGNDEFKAEANHQLLELIKKEQEKEELRKELRKTVLLNAYERPVTELQSEYRNIKEVDIKEKINDDISAQKIKDNLRAKTVLNYAIERYKLDENNYEITNDNKIKNLNNKQKPKNVIDFLQKECNLTTKQAIEECKYLLQNQRLKIENKVREELNTMPLKISICKDTNQNALSKWETVELNNYTELSSLLKQYPYSASIFDKNYRNGDNANSFGNVLIFDIDNDKYTSNLSIKEAQKILEQHNISAMILTTRSHNKDKKVSEKLQKKAGITPFEEYHNAERYRIIIPTNKAINIQSKEEYREFQSIAAKALKIDEYIDKSALNDRARLYYPAPASAIPIIIKSKIVLNIDELQDKAIENIKYQKEIKAEQDKKLIEVKEKIQELNKEQYSNYNSNNLSYADTPKIMNLNISDLIKNHEKECEEYEEGKYKMIKTPSGKYSLMENNVAYDFRNDIAYNNITYLQKIYQTTNLNKIAKELEKRFNDNFTKVNYSLVKESIEKSLQSATNDRTLEEKIKEDLNVKFCKIESTFITIADNKINLSSINLERKNIIEKLIKNREIIKQKQLQEEKQSTKAQKSIDYSK